MSDEAARESVDRALIGAAASAATEQDPKQREEQLIDELQKRTAELEEANRELRRVSHYRRNNGGSR